MNTNKVAEILFSYRKSLSTVKRNKSGGFNGNAKYPHWRKAREQLSALGEINPGLDQMLHEVESGI